MKRAISPMLVVAFVGLAGVARSDDKADPTGTWKWSVTFNNQTRDVTLKLKLEGDKLTGTISGRNNTETAIEDASFKDGTVAFSVTRERNGQKRHDQVQRQTGRRYDQGKGRIRSATAKPRAATGKRNANVRDQPGSCERT